MRSLLSLLLALLLLLVPLAPARAAEWGPAPDVPLTEELATLPATPLGWEVVPGPAIVVHGAPAHHATLEHLARHATRSLPALAKRLSVPIGTTIHVYVAESESQFHRLQPGTAPDWADGTAYPEVGAIFLKAPVARGGQDKPLQVVLDHELVHVLLGRAFHPQRPPRWLQEGMAQLLAGEVGPETTETLLRGRWQRDLFALDYLTRGFPRDPVGARLAYAQSADLLAWIEGTHGEPAITTLVREMAAGRNVRGAMRIATGETLDDLDAQWRARFDAPVLWLTGFDSDSLWALGGLLLLVGGAARRRRITRRIEAMADDEHVIDSFVLDLLAQGYPRTTQPFVPRFVMGRRYLPRRTE